LFDLHPKEDRKELFGRDKEIDYAISQLLSRNWLTIGGQREIGKTSLMKVVMNEMKKNYGFKGIYVNLRGVRNLSSLLKVILSEINNSKPSFKVTVKLNFIVGSAGIELKRGAKVVNSLIELFNSIEEDAVIGLDEVQEVSQASRQFLEVLGNVFASNPKVRFVFSGSYIGVIRALSNPSSSSPLHGRPPVLLNLRPFDEGTSRDFLRRGMEELNISFDKEDEVVKRLDGVVGWLTLFGNFYAVRKMSFETSMSSTIEEGKKIMIDEFKHFLEGKSNKRLYTTIMSVLKVVNAWKDVKRGVEIKLGNVDDKELSLALESLLNNNFIEKRKEGVYEIVDPILREIDYDKL
jgi:Predicted ATPase (AAA+ superfamily)